MGYNEKVVDSDHLAKLNGPLFTHMDTDSVPISQMAPSSGRNSSRGRAMLWGDLEDHEEDLETERIVLPENICRHTNGSRKHTVSVDSNMRSSTLDSSTQRQHESWSNFSALSISNATEGEVENSEGKESKRGKSRRLTYNGESRHINSPSAGMISRWRSSSRSSAFSETGSYPVSDDSFKVKMRPTIVSVSSATCAKRCSKLLRAVEEGFDAGHAPLALQSGTGGAYCFMDRNGKTVCVIKPADEEPLAPNNPKGYIGRNLGDPGFKPSVRVGEAGLREVAAFLLDHGGFAGVPKTALVKVQHDILYRAINSERSDSDGKLASLQAFVSHVGDVGDQGASRFPTNAVHRIGILDIRLFNTDRHSGNILLRKTRKSRFVRPQMSLHCGLDKLADFSSGEDETCKQEKPEDYRTSLRKFSKLNSRSDAHMKVCDGQGHFETELVPIDHGFCLPENLEPPYLEWLHWPQASIPFTQETLSYIASLNPKEDVERLREELPQLREECLHLVELTTILLKKGAAVGMTLAELGSIISRPFVGIQEDASQFEKICTAARKEALIAAASESSFTVGVGTTASIFDCDDIETDDNLLFSLDDGYQNSNTDENVIGDKHEEDNLYGRRELVPGDGSCLSISIPHSQTESVSSCPYNDNDLEISPSPESLSPEKIMHRSCRPHNLSRPVVIPRNSSSSMKLATDQESMTEEPTARRGRAVSSVHARQGLPWTMNSTTSTSVDFSSEGQSHLNSVGVLSNLKGRAWECFVQSFERHVDKLIVQDWQEAMAHLFIKSGTSCPV